MADSNDRANHIILIERIASIAARLDALDKARDTAHHEVDRRLDELNHLREEMSSDRKLLLPREVHDQFFNEYRQSVDRLNAAFDKCMQRDQFDQFFRDFGHWRDEVNGKLAQQSGATNNTRLWMAVITLVLLAASVLGRYLLK